METSGQLGVTQPRAMVSEWIKFRSLRSTWWSIGIALLISVGLGILFSALRGNDIANHGGFEQDPTALSLRGFFLAQLAAGVLGALFITGEYSTGMIRATLSAVPRRVPVWVAKIVIFAVVIFGITLAAAFVAFLGGQAVLSSYHTSAEFIPGPGGGIGVIPDAGGTLHSLGVSISHPGSVRAAAGTAAAGSGAAGFVAAGRDQVPAAAGRHRDHEHHAAWHGSTGAVDRSRRVRALRGGGAGPRAVRAATSRCVTGTRDTRCMSWVRRSREPRSRHRGGGDRHAEQDRERITQLAVSAERNRIAREMHDIVAHNLSVMIALTDGAALTVERD